MVVRSAILARQNDTCQNRTLMLYNFQINQNLHIFWRAKMTLAKIALFSRF